jgi:hypothetical protein
MLSSTASNLTPTDQKTANRMEQKEKVAELEFEVRLYEDFIKSPIWTLLKNQWQPIVDSATGAALSGKAVDRSFLAGKANGLHHFLKYPEKHVRELKTKIKQLGGQAS